MKKILTTGIIAISYLLFAFTLHAQPLKPKIVFKEDPLTHNVHIASDGEFYYTINGGRANKGQVQKFSFSGRLLDTYEFLLDMRSIMYSQKEKLFYVCTYEKKIYRINDLKTGRYEIVTGDLYDNEQANLAMSPDGKNIYYFSDGTLKIFKFPKGKLSKTITGLDCGKEFTSGNSCVATDGKYIYTFNGDYKMIFAYDSKGNKVKTFEISDGSYGFSLSCANGLVFVSDDGNYETGTWYGYDLWAK